MDESDESNAMDAALNKVANGYSSLLDAPLEQSPPKAIQQGPTMMSREARSLIHSEQGIVAWKVLTSQPFTLAF